MTNEELTALAEELREVRGRAVRLHRRLREAGGQEHWTSLAHLAAMARDAGLISDEEFRKFYRDQQKKAGIPGTSYYRMPGD